MEGVVIKSTGNIITVFSGGENYMCRVKGNFRMKDIDSTNPVAVGDRVKFETRDADSTITELLPRKNYIIRKSNTCYKY
jgi:ribosome biogenesis GTPase / thiamine phosphate phosphatase